MDHQKAPAKSKNTILKFLPKPTSSVSFQNPPIYSPTRDKIRSSEKPHKSHIGIGFSGPMVSMILADTRRKIKNNSDYFEPTSPRVSCMGQVKCKNKKDKPQLAGKSDSGKKTLGFKKIFGGVTLTPSGDSRRKSDSGKKETKAPSLGTMKRFSSGRDKFSDIDWRQEVAAMDSGDRRYDCDEEYVVVVPSSAPVIMRNPLGFDDHNIIRVAGMNLEPRNEINLWKRRTMKPPKPLQLHNF